MAQGSIGGFLPLSGGTLTGAIIAPDGTAALPPFAIGQANQGFYRRTADNVSLSINGVGRYEWSATQVKLVAANLIGWTASSINATFDTALSRVSAGIVAVGTGAAGNASGELRAAILSGQEIAAPAAPAADGFRIFAQDNGAGKTQLMVIFATGAAQQIAIQP